MSVHHACITPCIMRASPCIMRGGHPPYTPSVLARTHARWRVACFVASTFSFPLPPQPSGATPSAGRRPLLAGSLPLSTLPTCSCASPGKVARVKHKRRNYKATECTK